MSEEAAMVIEGATDASVFKSYVKHFLAPSLSEGQVVVMHKLSVHRTLQVRELMHWAYQPMTVASQSGISPL
jgi:transposase